MATAKKTTASAPAKKAAKAPAAATGIRPIKDTFTKGALTLLGIKGYHRKTHQEGQSRFADPA